MLQHDKAILLALNDTFNARLRQLIAGNNKDFSPLDLGNPSKMLLDSGFETFPIQMSVQRLVDKKLQSNHPFKLSSIAHMPEFIYDPIAVFQSKTRSESKVIFTEMEENNVNFVVAIETGKLIGNKLINSVRSIYPKDNVKDVLLWIAQDKLMEICNKEKILKWISKQQSNSADVTNLIEDSTKLINSLFPKQ